MKTKITVSDLDKRLYIQIRSNVSKFISKSAQKFDKKGIDILDIAPQVHEGARAYFKKGTVSTFDLDKSSKATYIGDITKHNKVLRDNYFDIVVCTEVLEHTLNPFDATNEMYRILKPGGLLLASVPFNFRIHGPLPDCWRFSEHGLRELFKKFKDIQIHELASKDRDLMPVHYTVRAVK